MRSPRVGRYILFAVAVVIALGGWMALKATEKQLRRMKADRIEPTIRATGTARLSPPRATGPLAPGADASTAGGSSGPSGTSGATGEDAGTSVPASESDARSGLPPGAIW